LLIEAHTQGETPVQDMTANHRHLAARLLAAALLAGAALAPVPAALAASPPGAVSSQTRALPWNGGEHLYVGVPATVDYVQGLNAGVVITGPSDLIRDIVVEDGAIRYQDSGWHWFGGWSLHWQNWRDSPVHIVVTAPRLSVAHVGGAGHLNLGRLAQDRLDLSVSGAGSVTASGAIRSLSLGVSGSGGARVTALTATDLDAHLSGAGRMTVDGTAESLRLHVSGAARADMAGLSLQTVVAGLSGSGSASVAPKRSADIGVSGAGNVRLVTNPAQLSTHRSGAGRIIRADGGDA
jgi:hypothetical protein